MKRGYGSSKKRINEYIKKEGVKGLRSENEVGEAPISCLALKSRIFPFCQENFIKAFFSPIKRFLAVRYKNKLNDMHRFGKFQWEFLCRLIMNIFQLIVNNQCISRFLGLVELNVTLAFTAEGEAKDVCETSLYGEYWKLEVILPNSCSQPL